MAKRPDPSKPAFIVGDSLGDIFAEAGIQLGKARPAVGRDVKVLCPACGGGRTREMSLSIKVDADGAGAAWHCFRGSCPGSSSVPGSGRLENRSRDHVPKRRERPPVVKPVLHTQAEQQRPESLYKFFEKRGISAETVDAFGIYGVSRSWPKTDDAGKVLTDEQGRPIWVEKPTIVCPYRWRAEVVNRKFRSIDKQFMQDRDALRTLYNADAIESPDVVVLVEGEFDVLACHEAGLRQVLSLPDGSPQKLMDEDDPRREDDKRFDALENCADVLEPVEKFVIATDADVPGGYLAEEFARRLGRERCWRVTWPEGCKDANDVLLRHMPPEERGKRPPTPEEAEPGRADLLRCIEQAQPWPLAGLFDMRPGVLRAFLDEGREPHGLESGIVALDEVARLPQGGGWLTVVTGIPSHGKSTLVRCWMAYLAMRHGLGIVWCSPEDNRPEILALRLAEIIEGQPVREAGTIMPAARLEHAEDWIRERVTFVYADDPNTEMTLDWLLARAEQAKRRRKRNLLLLDPWNEVEHQLGRGESETQYTGRWLRRLKAWGRAEGMGVCILAHPKQMALDPKTKEYPVADGYDISGSANWYNRADLGLTVYRRKGIGEGFPEVHCWKARFPAFGKRNAMARLKLDRRTGRLSSAARADDDDQQQQDEEQAA